MSAYPIPDGLSVRPLVNADSGAECLLLYRSGGVLAGRIERPALPLPGRRLWTLYDAAGRQLQAGDHPRNLNMAGLCSAAPSGDRDNG